MAVITGYKRQPDRVSKTDIPWPGGHKVLFAATIDHLPSHPTSDGRATDSCFALIGALTVRDLPVSTETTSVPLGVDLEAAVHPASTISTLH